MIMLFVLPVEDLQKVVKAHLANSNQQLKLLDSVAELLQLVNTV